MLRSSVEILILLYFVLCCQNGYANLSADIDDVDYSKALRRKSPLDLDIAAIVGKSAVDKIKQKAMTVEDFLTQTFHNLSQITMLHNIRVHVRYLDIWKHKNKVDISGADRYDALQDYFRDNNLNYDAFVVFQYFNDDVVGGQALLGRMCSHKSIVFIDVGEVIPTRPRYTGEGIFHEIGHLFGFTHSDDSKNCTCSAKDSSYCIMRDTLQIWNRKKHRTIEKCRMGELFSNIKRYPCLLAPMKMPRLFSTCGDAVLDPGEECDCGTKEMCQHFGADRCCDHNTCKFKSKRYECDMGECCKNCRFTRGNICRRSHGECDYVEKCDGKSRDCPKDKVKDNYIFCSNKAGFCFDGSCTNVDALCKYVYQRDDVFYHPDCAGKYAYYAKSNCDKLPKEAADVVCGQYPDPCNQLLCAHPSGFLKQTNYFVHNNVVCLIPDNDIRVGILTRSVDFTRCSLDAKSFCYKNKCTSDLSLLPNCDKDGCTEFDEKIPREINKLLYYPYTASRYTMYQYGKCPGYNTTYGVGKHAPLCS